jgi:hypothetical protein
LVRTRSRRRLGLRTSGGDETSKLIVSRSFPIDFADKESADLIAFLESL